MHCPSNVWPVGMITRKIFFKIHYFTGHFFPKKYLSLVFYDNRNLKIYKSKKSEQYFGDKIEIFYLSPRWTLCSPFWKSPTRDLTSDWQTDCTTDFLRDTSPPRSRLTYGQIGDCEQHESSISWLAKYQWPKRTSKCEKLLLTGQMILNTDCERSQSFWNP